MWFSFQIVIKHALNKLMVCPYTHVANGNSSNVTHNFISKYSVKWRVNCIFLIVEPIIFE